MIFKAPKTKKGLLLGSMLMASVISFDYFEGKDSVKFEDQNIATAGRFLGTGWVEEKTPCAFGERTVVRTYTLLWVIQLGETQVYTEPC